MWRSRRSPLTSVTAAVFRHPAAQWNQPGPNKYGNNDLISQRLSNAAEVNQFLVQPRSEQRDPHLHYTLFKITVIAVYLGA
jgi:hypothetical protein